MFTKQHYEVVASVLRDVRDMARRQEIATAFARRFAIDNERFNKERFLRAASAKDADTTGAVAGGAVAGGAAGATGGQDAS